MVNAKLGPDLLASLTPIPWDRRPQNPPRVEVSTGTSGVDVVPSRGEHVLVQRTRHVLVVALVARRAGKSQEPRLVVVLRQ
jgi:hypothetical protein